MKKEKKQAAQVYFPVSVYYQIKQAATRENKPMAEWIRNIVEKELSETGQKRKKLTDLPVYDWGHLPDDMSENLDKYIYDPS